MKKTLFLISVLILIGGLALFVNERKDIVVVDVDSNKVSSSQSSANGGLQLPIDPAVCKDNPEGYVYFKVGEESFRYTKDSPIKVGFVKDQNSSSSDNVDIPKGCEGNPYTKFSFRYEHQEEQNPIGDIKFDKFRLIEIPPERYEIVSMGQELMEDQYYQFKKNNMPCDESIDDVIRCIWPPSQNPDLPRDEWARVYVSENSKYSTAVNRSYILYCYKYAAAGLRCETFYRLYNSIDITYAFYPGKNNWDESNVIKFDKHIRQLFEEMRVKH